MVCREPSHPRALDGTRDAIEFHFNKRVNWISTQPQLKFIFNAASIEMNRESTSKLSVRGDDVAVRGCAQRAQGCSIHREQTKTEPTNRFRHDAR